MTVFKEKFDYLAGLGLNSSFDPLLNVEGGAQVQTVSEEVEGSVEGSNEYFHEAHGYEGDIESANGANCFDSLSQGSVGPPSASSNDSLPSHEA